jgi:hypothetical protein
MDTVDFTGEDDATNEYTYATSVDAASEYLRVAYITPNDAAAEVVGTKAKRTFLVDMSEFGTASTVQFKVNNIDVFDINGDGTAAAIDMTSNIDAMYLAVADTDNIARAASAGATMSVTKNGNASIAVTVGTTLDSAIMETTNAIASPASMLTSDILSITVGNQTVTGILNKDATTGVEIARRIQSLWSTAQTASPALFDFSVSAVASSSIEGTVMTFSALDKGNGGVGVTPVITATSATATRVAPIVLPLRIGATKSTADNSSTGTDLLVTFESTVVGATLANIGQPPSSAASVALSDSTINIAMETTTNSSTIESAISELHTNLRALAKTGTATTLDQHPDESWGDVVYAEDGSPAAASNAVSYSRIGWL